MGRTHVSMQGLISERLSQNWPPVLPDSVIASFALAINFYSGINCSFLALSVFFLLILNWHDGVKSDV